MIKFFGKYSVFFLLPAIILAFVYRRRVRLKRGRNKTNETDVEGKQFSSEYLIELITKQFVHVLAPHECLDRPLWDSAAVNEWKVMLIVASLGAECGSARWYNLKQRND